MSQPLLPRANPAIGDGLAGQWIEEELGFLSDLSQRLTFEQETYKEIHSIPNPWSRPVQLISAFCNINYPNRLWLIDQYRGLLATLALAKKLRLKITATHLKLNDENFQSNDFGKCLLSLRPKDSDSILLNNPDSGAWTEIYLFELDNVVIGMTSPATLVCPTGYFPDILKQTNIKNWLKWEQFHLNKQNVELGFFTDPLKASISAKEKEILASWLRNLSNKLPAVNIEGLPNNYNFALAGSVRTVLDAYIADLGINNNDADQPDGQDQPFGISLAYAPLDSLCPASIKQERSHVEVKPADGKYPQKKLYIVDPFLPANSRDFLGVPLSEINVIGSTSLRDFSFLPPDALAEYELTAKFANPATFFLSEIAFSRTSNLLPGSWLGQKMTQFQDLTILLPFQNIIQEYFSSEYLEQNLTIESCETEEGSGVKISLRLYLSGLQNRATYTITKAFPLRSENELTDLYPTVALWPNLPNNPDINWREFFLLESVTDRGGLPYAFRIEAPTRQKISEEISAEKKPDSSQQKYTKTAQYTNRKFSEEEYYYWQCDWRPDILEVRKDDKYLGMIPLKIPQPQQGIAAKWAVGVDFGTSFTNISLRKGDEGTSERFAFNPSLLKVTLGSEVQYQEFHDSIYRNFFIPDTLVPDGDLPPMSTALITQGWQDSGSAPKIITEARIYNPSNASAFSEHAKTNIKWENKKYQQPFLSQLVRMISAQAALENVREINWSISYPSAFSDETRTEYESTWGDVIQEMKQISRQEQNLVLPFKTESITFAQYFADVREPRENLIHTTCIDIGGGTSDLSIWQKNKLIHQSSVPYAGRDLFHSILRNSLEYSDEIFGGKAFGKDLSKNLNNFDSILDLYLRLYGEVLIKGYRDNSNNQRSREFRTLLAFAHCGLFHYIGLVQKWLKQEERIQNDSFTSLLLGGNGSRFIQWLSPSGNLGTGSGVNKLIEGIMLAATGLKTNPQLFTLSQEPKHEACRGLVPPKKENLTVDPEQDAYPFLGEACIINGQQFAPHDRLELTERWHGTVIDKFIITSTTEFEQYIQNFNQVIRERRIEAIDPLRNFKTGELLQLDDNLRTLLNTRLTQQCLRKQGLEGNNVEPDPPFLMVLKSFLDVLSKQWSRAGAD